MKVKGQEIKKGAETGKAKDLIQSGCKIGKGLWIGK